MVWIETTDRVNTPPYGIDVTAKRKVESSRRTRSDWITAATQSLAREGIGAVRVEALARELGVTKGSFYWHFEDLDALLVAIFEAWEQNGTQRIIDLVEREGGTAEAKMRHLWAICSGPNIGPELALRDFARRDARVAEIVERVDERRVSYLRTLLAAHGCRPDETEARAMLIYSLLIGSYFIRVRHGRKSRETVLEQAVSILLQNGSSRSRA
jgi:AcrR family transcriptional regulator